MGFFSKWKEKVKNWWEKDSPVGKNNASDKSWQKNVNENYDDGIPRHEDGSPYRYEMVCDGGLIRVYGDTTEDMLAYLIEDYQNFTNKEKTMARVRHAIDTKTSLQIHINKYFQGSRVSRMEEVILNNPQKHQPLIEEWTSSIPLVLVDTFYTPYSHIEKPKSRKTPHDNIWWLNPTKSELNYLISLHETSYLDLYQSIESKNTSPTSP